MRSQISVEIVIHFLGDPRYIRTTPTKQKKENRYRHCHYHHHRHTHRLIVNIISSYHHLIISH